MVLFLTIQIWTKIINTIEVFFKNILKIIINLRKKMEEQIIFLLLK